MTPESDPVRVLWADDDASHTLRPLQVVLQARGLTVSTETNYHGALTLLEESQKQDSTKFHALLVDVILAHRDRRDSLSGDLGLTLARRGVPLGIKNIVFLSVIPRVEIAGAIQEMQNFDPLVRVNHVHKATLLEPGQIEILIRLLSAHGEGPTDAH